MRKKRKAFTLIELMIVLAIISTILGSIYLFFLSNTRSLNSSEANVELHDQAQAILDTMGKDFMEARKIEGIVNTDGTSLLDKASGDDSCDISSITIKPLTGHNIVYTINDGIVTRSILEDGVTRDVGKYTQSIVITPSDSKKFRDTGAVDIVLKLTTNTGNQVQQYEASSNITFRNADVTD